MDGGDLTSMRATNLRVFGATSGTALLLLVLSGCSHMKSLHWPWHRRPPPPPESVHELDERALPPATAGASTNAVAAPGAPATRGAAVPATPAAGTGAAVPSADATPAPGFPQYWKRNTLVLDLEPISGFGGLVVRPRNGTTWPVRLALRVMPGSVGQLEVRAAQRVILPIIPTGAKPIDLELAPGVYTGTTEQITVTWGPQQ